MKCRCLKWTRMTRLDICNTSYGKKKGRKSNWQFDSRPQEVRNQPDFCACRWSVIHRWKALDESYNFASNLIPIEGLSKKLWPYKVAGVQPWQFRDSLLGVPRQKVHLDEGLAERHRKYYMGEGGGFPWVRAMVSLVNPKSVVACPSTKGVAT